MINRKRLLFVMMLLLLTVLLASCSKEGVETKNPTEKSTEVPEAKQKPVELSVYIMGGAAATYEKLFWEHYGDAIQRKFPHITLKISPSGTASVLKLGEVITAGAQFDIISMSLPNIPSALMNYGLAYDHADLIKQNKYELNQLVPQTVEMLKSVSGDKIYGLPVANPGSILKFLYNRDLFDKFGVPYPKDGMKWDEVYELARKMTRFDNGIQYRGAAIAFDYTAWSNQRGAGFINPTTHKSLFATDKRWQQVVTDMIRFYQIPGNGVEAANIAWGKQHTAFITDGNVAMDFTLQSLSEDWKINWAVASYPELNDQPGVGSGFVCCNIFSVTSTSKHKNEAFQAIAYLTSKEHQIHLSKKGIELSSAVVYPEVRAVFGEDLAWAKGRNIQALYPKQFAPAYPLTPYDDKARAALLVEMNNLAVGTGVDLNTALRRAAEATDIAIETQKAGEKK